jgi:ubiquinone/menaquinone biosynthesis C-methylase UbiE
VGEQYIPSLLFAVQERIIEMNFFVHKSVAERYAKYRPHFHPLVIEKIRAHLNIQRPMSFALDVGCGTGQSTVVLKEIADLVVGADISAEMLGFAEKNSGIQYIQAAAEKLAIKGNSSDLLIASLAYHWFDGGQFFAEARRVLKEGAWLIISNNGFSGRMKENPEFEQWIVWVYEKHYPTPPRNSTPITQEFVQQHGFKFVHQEEYQNDMQFTAEELSAYLITQSNVIAATEQGNEKVEEVYLWLTAQTRPFFGYEEAIFVFEGYVWYLQKVSG